MTQSFPSSGPELIRATRPISTKRLYTILEYPRERTNLCQGPVCNEARKALRVYSQLTAEWYNWRRKCRGMDELGHTTCEQLVGIQVTL